MSDINIKELSKDLRSAIEDLKTNQDIEKFGIVRMLLCIIY